MIEIDGQARPHLAMNPESACFVLLEARGFEGKAWETDPDSGSDASDALHERLCQFGDTLGERLDGQ